MSRDMRFPTMWYVRPAKAQTILRIRANRSESLLVANYYMSVKLLIELNLVFQSLTGGCTGSFESTLVKMAHCWKSHVMVQIFLNTGPRRQSVTCLATDACLTADPGVPSLIAALSYTFMEIDHEMISTVIFLPSAESFKKEVVSYKRKYALEVLV